MAGASSNVQPEEDEGIVLQPNIMEGPGERLSRPRNMEVDLWTEVLRLNRYLGQRTHINLLQEIWNLNSTYFFLFIKYEGLNHCFGPVTEVLRLNSYLGQRTHLNLLQEIWILSIIFLSLLHQV